MEQFVRRARAGDGDAFANLVDLTGNRCFAIAFRILREQAAAEDAVQQAYLQAWSKLPQLKAADHFESWLYRTLVNVCYLELRRRRTRPTLALVGDSAAGPDVLSRIDDRDLLERAFARLSPEHRAAFVLHHYAGLPLKTIAEVAGIPAGTVKSRLHYAARQLREALDAPGTERRGRSA
ncbi:MAG TPA: sigma-70 family RNA polymerase sigma factor [Candidatus Limnocylindria bacterium]